MIISCPQCDTTYNIPDETVRPEGRKVRCSSCSYRWHVSSPPDIDPSERRSTSDDIGITDDFDNRFAVPDESVSVEPAQVENEGGGKTSAVSILGWICALLLVIALATFVLARQHIATLFPSMNEVYTAIGLPVSVEPALSFSEVVSEEIRLDGRNVIVIKGTVVNDSHGEQTVPRLRVSLLDSERKEVRSGIVDPQSTIIEAGGQTVFEARFPDPGEEARHFEVVFDDQPPSP